MTRRQIQEVSFSVESNEIRGQGRKILGINGKPRKSDEDRAWEREIRDAYSAQCPYKDFAGFADEVRIMITTFRKLPANTPLHITTDVDVGNPKADAIAASVISSLKGIAFRDAKQVTQLLVVKSNKKRRVNEKLSVTITYYAEVGER